MISTKSGYQNDNSTTQNHGTINEDSILVYLLHVHITSIPMIIREMSDDKARHIARLDDRHRPGVLIRTPVWGITGDQGMPI